MGVDVDLSQYCDVILLWNAVAMFLISFFTDYWEYRTYDFDNLLPALRNINQTIVRDYERSHITSSVVVEFPAQRPCDAHFDPGTKSNQWPSSLDEARIQKSNPMYRMYLFMEYGNLFKECNDLHDTVRLQLGQDNACYYYPFTNTAWFHQDQSIYVMETLTLVLGSAAAVLSMIAMFNGTMGAIKNNLKLMTSAGMCLAAQGILYLCTITIFATKLHFISHYFTGQSGISCQESLINSHRRHSLGWSYAAAVLSLVLSAVSTYVFIANSKVIRRRRARIKRRQRMEAALMSSCKQEVALAVRAKMILITPENDDRLDS